MANEEKVNLGQFNLDTSGLLKATQETKETLDKLVESQKAMRKEGDTSSEGYIKITAQVKKMRTEYNAQIKVVQQLTNAETKEVSVTNALNKALGREVTSIAEARKQNKDLLALRNEINITTEEGQKQLQRVNKQLDENNKFIKENVSSIEQQKMSIGDYKTAIIEASKETSIFGQYQRELMMLFTAFTPIFEYLNNQYKEGVSLIRNYAAGTEGMSKAQRVAAQTSNVLSGALKILKVALISTGIGAIVVALGSLVAYLTSTQSGIDKLNRILVPLKTVFQTLFGLFQEVGEALFEAFSDPFGTLEKLYDFIKNQIMRQFESFSKILEGIFTLDFGMIKEGFNDLAEQAEENIKAVGGYFDKVGDAIEEAYTRGQRIQQLQEEIEKRENNFVLLQSEQNRLIKEQNKIAEDQTKTLAEREAAAQKSIEASQKILEEEQKILDIKIEQMKLEQQSNDTSRADEKELNELIAQRNEAETRALELQTTQQNKLNTIRQQAQSEALKAIDARIKKQQEEIDLFIAQQGFRKKSAEEELQLAQEVANRKKQILLEELNSNKISQTKYNTEILKINNDLAKQQAEISIENFDREIEILRDRVDSLKNQEKFMTQVRLEELINQQNILSEQERNYQEQRFNEGLINEQEYLDAVKNINVNHQNQLDQLRKDREQAIRDERALQTEAEYQAIQERGATIFELESFQIEQQRQRDIEVAREKYTDEALLAQAILNINTKSAIAQGQIEASLAKSKIDTKIQVLSAISQLFGKETALGKAAAIAQTTINTYSAATAALAPPPLGLGPIFGPVVAGITIASGLANVGKIVGININGKQGNTLGGLSSLGESLGSLGQLQNVQLDSVPPFAEGGKVTYGIPIRRNNGDNVLATLKKGEVVLTENHQAALGGDQTFRAIGVPGFASGGSVGTPPASMTTIQNAFNRGFDSQLAALISDAVTEGAQQGTFSGSQLGIRDLSTDRQVALEANF